MTRHEDVTRCRYWRLASDDSVLSSVLPSPPHSRRDCSICWRHWNAGRDAGSSSWSVSRRPETLPSVRLYRRPRPLPLYLLLAARVVAGPVMHVMKQMSISCIPVCARKSGPRVAAVGAARALVAPRAARTCRCLATCSFDLHRVTTRYFETNHRRSIIMPTVCERHCRNLAKCAAPLSQKPDVVSRPPCKYVHKRVEPCGMVG